MNPQMETRALRTSPQSSHHSVEAKNQEARTHIFIHVVFPVPSSDIQMLRKRVQAARKEVPIRGGRGAKAAMLLWRRVSACLYKVKVVRGLSPKARRARDEPERHAVCSVCVLRLRFFEPGVEERRRSFGEESFVFCSLRVWR